MVKSLLFPAAILATIIVATAPAAAPAAAERPKLWSIEVMDGDKAVSRVDICADSAVQKGFAGPAPEVNSQPCDRLRAPIETGDA